MSGCREDGQGFDDSGKEMVANELFGGYQTT
jgi:hypothetical protein